MKRFMNILKNNKDICLSLIVSISIVTAIFLIVFEPFNEIPFVYNQF